MRFANPREVFGSLHFRLTVWNTLALFVFVAITLIGVREALRLALLKETNQLLLDDALEMRLTVQEFLPNLEQVEHELQRKVSTHAHRGLFVQLLDREGGVQWEAGALPPERIARTPRVSDRRLMTVGKYRVDWEQLSKSDPRLSWLLVGSSLAPVQDDVAKLTNTMLIAGAVVLLVAPLGGYWLAGRATRPLARIIDTTARLHPSNLEERLQIRGTRDELDRLSLTVNALLDRIAAYINQSEQFTANAAHELRSPLAAIQNSLEVGLNAERTADEYRELLGETLEECGVLRDLVNQMLLLAESDAGRLEIGPDAIRLDEVARKSHEMFVGVAEAAELKLRLQCNEPVLVFGDANRLRQVVNNLIDNAIKFSRPGGVITVAIHREHGRSAVLQVSDTGTGISPEDFPHVFERFYRGDKSRQRARSGGTGLGLSICSSIVAAHNGTIKVESTLGQGTTVTVTLPSAEAARRDEIGLPLKQIESSPVA